jgi:hypothetical protein
MQTILTSLSRHWGIIEEVLIEETIPLSDPSDNPVQQANFDAVGNRKELTERNLWVHMLSSFDGWLETIFKVFQIVEIPCKNQLPMFNVFSNVASTGPCLLQNTNLWSQVPHWPIP